MEFQNQVLKFAYFPFAFCFTLSFFGAWCLHFEAHSSPSLQAAASMASLPRSQLPKANVCQICGDKGYPYLLIYCRSCLDSFVHHYCLDKFSPDDNIKWWCFDCKGEDIIRTDPLRKSERISVNKQKSLDKRNHWKEKMKQNRKLVRMSNDICETGEPAIDGHLPTKGLETNLVNERQGVLFTDSYNVQVPLFVDNNHPPTSDTLFRQPYFEPDDSRSTDPINEPVWRGCFNIEEKDLCVTILAHLSNIACLKVSDAAAAFPPMLDVVLLNKRVIWPNSFEDAPPTATTIGLYFFPACERDESVYDGLLDEVIDNELALKVNMTDNVELLIFPSSELPLQHCRFKKKYFLWGVFKKNKSPSSKQRSNNTLLSEPTTTGNEENLDRCQRADHPSTTNQAYQSQKSNVPPSKNNTPESISLKLNKPRQGSGKKISDY